MVRAFAVVALLALLLAGCQQPGEDRGDPRTEAPTGGPVAATDTAGRTSTPSRLTMDEALDKLAAKRAPDAVEHAEASAILQDGAAASSFWRFTLRDGEGRFRAEVAAPGYRENLLQMGFRDHPDGFVRIEPVRSEWEPRPASWAELVPPQPPAGAAGAGLLALWSLDEVPVWLWGDAAYDALSGAPSTAPDIPEWSFQEAYAEVQPHATAWRGRSVLVQALALEDDERRGWASGSMWPRPYEAPLRADPSPEDGRFASWLLTFVDPDARQARHWFLGDGIHASPAIDVADQEGWYGWAALETAPDIPSLLDTPCVHAQPEAQTVYHDWFLQVAGDGRGSGPAWFLTQWSGDAGELVEVPATGRSC